MLFVFNQLFKVVVHGIRITNSTATLTSQCYSRFSLIGRGGSVTYVIGTGTIISISIVAIVIVTEFRFETQVLDDFPSKACTQIVSSAFFAGIVIN